MSETTVEYFFDPACPWTWLTSRWLVDATRQRDVAVTWRSLSLSVVNAGKIPEQYADRLRASAAAHRVFAALADAGRNDLIGEMYTAIGSRTHDGGQDLTLDLVREAAEAAGAGKWAGAVDDNAWDALGGALHGRGAGAGRARRRLAGPGPRLAAGRDVRPDRQPRPPG